MILRFLLDEKNTFFEEFVDINVPPQVPGMFFMTFEDVSMTGRVNFSALFISCQMF